MRIGCCGPTRKWEAMKWSEFIQFAQERGVEVVYIDLSKPIEEQGPFDIIIHKMTYFMTGHDMSVDPGLNRLYIYYKAHPEVTIIDDLDAVALTLDREEMNAAFEKVNWDGFRVSPPRVVFMGSEDADISSVKFPVLVKPKGAASTDANHMMRLATGPEQLKGAPMPCILQEFVNHGGIVYKIYALGDHLEVGARPSMRDIAPDECLSVDFHSQHSEVDNGLWTRPRDLSGVKMPIEDFKKISAVLRRELKLNLIGFDILIDNDNNYWLVDLNYFPGYKNVENLWQKFFDFFMQFK